jgi:hypothetical protein
VDNTIVLTDLSWLSSDPLRHYSERFSELILQYDWVLIPDWRVKASKVFYIGAWSWTSSVGIFTMRGASDDLGIDERIILK